MKVLLQPLTAEAFAAFGQVIEVPRGFASDAPVVRHNALAAIDLDAEGSAIVSLMAVQRPIALPYAVPFLERHPFGSQAFIPAGTTRFLVVAARGEAAPDLGTVQAFLTDGRQGVNIGRGVWHGPLAGLDTGGFVVVDRQGPGDNGQVFRGVDITVDG